GEGKDLAERVQQQIVDLGLAASNIQVSEVARRIKVFSSNIQALLTYRPGGYGGHVVVLNSTAELPDHPRPKTLGWEEHVKASAVQQRYVPGNHFNLVFEPHAGTIAQELLRLTH